MADIRFYAVDYAGKRFIGTSLDGERNFVTLRDQGLDKIWSGTMHRTLDEAQADADRKPGMFDGACIGVVELREVTADECEELGAEVSTNPDLYRETFRHSLASRMSAAENPDVDAPGTRQRR